MPPKSDWELVEAVRNGGGAEFADLYRAHVASVRAVSLAVVGNDKETVADIVQDTFLHAFYGLASLEDPSRLRPWLSSIARNLATDYLRDKRHFAAVDEQSVIDLADSRPDPASLAELSDLARQVSGCVAGLSPRDATAIALVTHFGFATQDVASALGLSAGTAKVLLHRARRRLRQAFVLQALAERPDLACPELRRLLARGAPAAPHVKACDRCITAVAGEFLGEHLAVTPPTLRLDRDSAGTPVPLLSEEARHGLLSEAAAKAAPELP